MTLTGNFKKFILFITIIIFHELGHVLASVYYNWNIEKILLLPFGGITIFNEKINKSLKEELIICICGPLAQILFYLLVRNNLDISNIHYNLLIFNLLPIIPLDGSKLLSIILKKIFPFKKSLNLTNLISIMNIVLITCLLLINKNFLLALIILFLVIKVIDELKNVKYIFNRFLLERYYDRFNLKKTKIITSSDLTKMYFLCNHLFYIDNKYYTEKEIIKKRFDL